MSPEPEPKDYRLFHYTSQIAYLEQMLADGIWPRFCVDEFDWLFGNGTCVAFPMSCFCDIPIPAARAHRNRYGNYALGIHKDFADDYDLNPVWYIQDGTTIEERLRKLIEHRGRVTLDTIPGLLKPFLPYLKPTTGAQPDRNATRSGTLEILAFEEELEWRYTPLDLMHTWKFDYHRQTLTEADHALSIGHRFPVDHNDIDVVFVPTQAEVDALIAQFPTLADKITTWP